MAFREPQTLTMEINHRPLSFPEGVTVHRAAELNGIYIPSLCSHKDLSPFGGCRLCMVEIEGQRGYPLSCNTVAREGMKVLTDTVMLRELRQEILKLILSEHPSSCLVCGEKSECKDYQGTIRKAGVTTGCRYCPNDGQCELQDLVEKIGVSEIDFPIYYHGYEPEQDDPFYDRDYNVCILCGRCVRMCQEVRGTSVLAFTHRGPKVKIGPAFGRNHRDAGCEFCGACVDVCPTGALADKASKWEGKPDGFRVSTCPFCGLGCQLELEHKNGRLIKARAHLDPEVNDGQLCVRGRFCLPEVTHHFERAKKPSLQKGAYFRQVSWAEALEKVAAELRGVPHEEFVMLVSPDLSTESLFAAQMFAREVLDSPNIDSSARLELRGGLGLWSMIFSLPISVKTIARSDVILAAGLDSRFNFSVAGTRLRKALSAGARLVTIDPRDSNLARYTDSWLRPTPGKEGLLLQFLADGLAGRAVDAETTAEEASVEAQGLKKALQILSSGKDLTVILGPQVFHYGDTAALVRALLSLAQRPRTNFVPLYYGSNARAALEMGVFPELAPGGLARPGAPVLPDIMSGVRRPRVLYLVGEVPLPERPPCDFLIVQDIYYPPFPVDAFLPASTFAEAGGTLINLEGRVQEVVAAENHPEGAVTGFSRPDWRIFSDLAEALGSGGLKFSDAQEVREKIRLSVPDFPASIDRAPRRLKPVRPPAPEELSIGNPGEGGEFLLVAEPGGYRHRGIDISSKVGGLRELELEEGFRMHPDDLAALGLKAGDVILVSSDGGRVSGRGVVKPDPEGKSGVIYFTRPVVWGGLGHRRSMWLLSTLRQNPVRVSVARAAS